MPTVQALEHIFSSVERGLSATQGRGFQTVAVSEELVRTEDLRVLERAAFYSVTGEQRLRAELPVKETFFHLPSGRFAIGRTVDLGLDSIGREGNYLTHHFILDKEEFMSLEANPFAVLDSGRIRIDKPDLTPRLLAGASLDLDAVRLENCDAQSDDLELRAQLAIAVADAHDKPVLLIGDEKAARCVLKGIFSMLPADDRLRQTFSTAFFESDHLRSLFSIVSVDSRGDRPDQSSYIVFDLGEHEFARMVASSVFAEWLADCARTGRWRRVHAVNTVLNRLQSSQPIQNGRSLLLGPACAILCEKAANEVAHLIAGDHKAIVKLLRTLPDPKPMAIRLLGIGSPSEICGTSDAGEPTRDCLSALRSKAGPKAWRSWARQWKDDPLFKDVRDQSLPWKRFWLKRKRTDSGNA